LEQVHDVEIERLEKLVSDDRGAPAFSALAEAHRRAGRPDVAAQVARDGLVLRPEQLAGRVALGLALLDLGRMEEARGELAQVLESLPDHAVAKRAFEELPTAEPVDDPLAHLAEREVEAALAEARADRESMRDADQVAATALRSVEDEPPEEHDPVTADGSPFVTQTVAEILEQQGHHDRAEQVRRTLETPNGAPDLKRLQTIATLERWLEKLAGRQTQ
jgi:tetratricopeptide (TPR) repeat protein